MRNGCRYGPVDGVSLRECGAIVWPKHNSLCTRDCTALTRKTIIHIRSALILAVQGGHIAENSGIRLSYPWDYSPTNQFVKIGGADSSFKIHLFETSFCIWAPPSNNDHLVLKDCAEAQYWELLEDTNELQIVGTNRCMNLDHDHWDTETNFLICDCEGDGTHNEFMLGTGTADSLDDITSSLFLSV